MIQHVKVRVFGKYIEFNANTRYMLNAIYCLIVIFHSDFHTLFEAYSKSYLRKINVNVRKTLKKIYFFIETFHIPHFFDPSCSKLEFISKGILWCKLMHREELSCKYLRFFHIGLLCLFFNILNNFPLL